MVNYKLTYFPGRGLGEIARQIFHLAEVPFEDNRVPMDKWASIKNTLPFEQMPILEIDGQVIPQSLAIVRYLAKQYGYYGKCPYEQAIVDALADQYKDFYVEIKQYYYKAIGVFPHTPEELEQAKNEILFPAREKYLRYMTNYLKKSSSGFLAGGELTFADLILAEHIFTLTGFIPEYADAYPEVKAHFKKVTSIPLLKQWIETRPVTNF